MNKAKTFKNKGLFQGIGIGYVICLVTHIIAALLPMYVVLPFAEGVLGHGHDHHHAHHGLLSHILGDILIFTMIIIPVALLTYFGHKLVRYYKCKCGDVHIEDPCESCHHKKF